MLLRNAVRELRHRPLRATLAAGGVAVAMAMLTDMTMLSGGIGKSFGALLESPGYALRVSPRGTLPFDTEATIEGFASLRERVARTAGVETVVPVLAATLAVEAKDRVPGGAAVPTRSRRTLALGVGGDGGLHRLTGGEEATSGEVVVSEALAESLDLEIGDPLRLAPARGFGSWARAAVPRVSGTAAFVFAARGAAPVSMPLADLQALTDQEDEVSFAMIAATDGADPEAVRDDVAAAVPRVEVVTLEGIVAQVDRRLSYFRQLALILGSVSLLVAALLVGTIAAVSIGERADLLAALRAIGVSRRRIVAELAAESAAMCAIAGTLGLGIGVIVAGRLESILADFPGLPVGVRFFVSSPGELLGSLSLLVGCGTLAAIAPAWRATRREASALLESEAR